MYTDKENKLNWKYVNTILEIGRDGQEHEIYTFIDESGKIIKIHHNDKSSKLEVYKEKDFAKFTIIYRENELVLLQDMNTGDIRAIAENQLNGEFEKIN